MQAWVALALLVGRRLDAGRRPVAASLLLLGLVCDPLIETYARFYLSDLSAALLFAAFAVQLAGLRAAGRGVGGWVALAAYGIGAILLRIAYVPIEILTLLLCLAAGLLHPERRRLAMLLPVLLVPLAGAGTVAAANHVVFARSYPGEIFINRYSGTFLMSVFSPAITLSDIRSAGIPVTDAEFRSMQITDYDRRTSQIWGAEPYYLRNVILARPACA